MMAPLESPADVDRAIQSMIAPLAQSCNGSSFSVECLRTSAAESLADIRADNAAHGEDPDVPFADLVMWDSNPVDAAVFAITVFSPDEVTIYAGVGNPQSVIALVNRFSMAEVVPMIEAFTKHFGVDAHILRVPRSLAEFWLAG